MDVGGNKNRVEEANARIDMDNNNDDDKDGSKDDKYYDDGDDNDNDGEEKNEKNNNTTDIEESDDGKGKNNTGKGSFIGLDERVYAAIDILSKKCQKVDIECGVLGLVMTKK